MTVGIKPESVDFGVLIAFVAPGLVGFAGLAHVSDVAGAWMSAAPDKPQDLGVFLLVLLSSLSMGLGISGVRALCVDILFFGAWTPKWLSWLKIAAPVIDWSKVTDSEVKLAAVLAVRDGFYRYFQFYGNMAVALVTWVSARTIMHRLKYHHLTPGDFWLLATTTVGVVLLLVSAHDSARRYSKALKNQEVLKEESGE